MYIYILYILSITYSQMLILNFNNGGLYSNVATCFETEPNRSLNLMPNLNRSFTKKIHKIQINFIVNFKLFENHIHYFLI